MARSRWERIAPLSGAAFVALIVVAELVYNNFAYRPPASELQAFFEGNAGRIQVAGYLGTVSALFLAWFAGSVRHSLRTAEGGTGRLSAVAFGGGVIAAGVVAAAFTALYAGGERGGAAGGIGLETVTVFAGIYGSMLGNALPVAFAVLIGAAAVTASRSAAWPLWIVWVSALLVVGSIAPSIGYIFAGVDMLWILFMSLWLFTTGRPDS